MRKIQYLLLAAFMSPSIVAVAEVDERIRVFIEEPVEGASVLGGLESSRLGRVALTSWRSLWKSASMAKKFSTCPWEANAPMLETRTQITRILIRLAFLWLLTTRISCPAHTR